MRDVKAARWMARERKGLAEYLARVEREGVLPQARQQLVDYASGRRSVGDGANALDLLAGVHGAGGSWSVLSGDEQGFAEIDLALAECFWLIRLLTRGYDLDERPNKRPRVMMERVATCWMHAEAIGADAFRSWLDGLVRRLDAGDGSVGGRSMSPLCTLMAHFVTGRDPLELERAGWAPIGVYAPVVVPGVRAIDYDALANYHQRNVDGSGFPPFSFYPYRIAPFELLAIARRTGVAIEGGHPLIESPLAKPRNVIEVAITDELRLLGVP